MHFACISNQVQCYEWPNGVILNSYHPQPKNFLPIRSASWANNAEWMCIVNALGQVEVISFKDTKTKFLHAIEDIENANYATFQNLNKRDVAIAQDKKILIYDMKHSCVKKEFSPPCDNSGFYKIIFDSRDMYLCAAARNNHIYVYDSSGLSSTFHATNTGNIKNFSINDQGGLKIAACTNMGSIIMWELGGATNIYSDPSKCFISGLVYRNNSIMYITENRQVVIRDCFNTLTLSKIDLGYIPHCIDLCSDGVRFAICSDTSTIYTYDVRSLKQPLSRIIQQRGLKINQIVFCKPASKRATFSPMKCCDANEINVVHTGFYQGLDTDSEISRLTIPPESFCRVPDSVTNASFDDRKAGVKMSSNTFPIQFSCTSEVSEMVRNAVRDELDQIKLDMRRQVVKAVQETTKNNFYDLRLALVKEFVKIQDILCGIQRNSCSSNRLTSLTKDYKKDMEDVIIPDTDKSD